MMIFELLPAVQCRLLWKSQVQGRPVDEAHLPLPGRYITLAVRGQHLQRILMQGPFGNLKEIGQLLRALGMAILR